MSFIKRYMEQEQAAQYLVDALQALLEHEKVDNEVSVGISKRIISERSVEGLSSKQLNVFEKYIKPFIEPECEGYCGGKIDISEVPNALNNEFEEGGLYCQSCIHDRQKLK